MPKLTPEQLARRRSQREEEKAILAAAAKKRAKQEQEERERALKKQREEPDESDYSMAQPFVSPFAHDTGGGSRIIRSTRNLGG